jgi:hypothetical protein
MPRRWSQLPQSQRIFLLLPPSSFEVFATREQRDRSICVGGVTNPLRWHCTSVAMMMVLTEAGLSCSPQPTPPHHHQRTASLSSSTTMMASTTTALAPITVFGRSHSCTESMLRMEDVTYQRCLSATISEVLHSLSKLSTESSEDGAVSTEDGNSSANHGPAGVEEVSMSSSNGFDRDASFRGTSVDASAADEGSVPPPPASLHTPVMQRQTSLQLTNPQHYPTLKREHSANLSSSSSNSTGYYNNYSLSASSSSLAPLSRHHPHPFTHYHGGGGGSNKKSRSGSFAMIQSAPHLPLSPELDASRSGGGCCCASPNQSLAGTAEESRFMPNAANHDSLANAAAATRASSTGDSAPVVWKSHIQLPPPMFSPLIYQPQGAEDNAGSHAAAVAAAANTLAKSLSLHPPPLLHEPQQRDSDFDRWMVGHPSATTLLLPPPLQPELRSFDEHDDVTVPSHGPGPRLQQRRRPQLSELSSSLYFPPPPPASTSGPSAPLLVLPPPMPLMSSPSPSPKVGPRRILRMRKADSIDLALP